MTRPHTIRLTCACGASLSLETDYFQGMERETDKFYSVHAQHEGTTPLDAPVFTLGGQRFGESIDEPEDNPLARHVGVTSDHHCLGCTLIPDEECSGVPSDYTHCANCPPDLRADE